MPVEVTEEYIRIRVRLPEDFNKDTFRTVWLSKPKGINSVQGKLKNPPEGQVGSMVVQSLLFVKEKWTREEALTWAREHDYKPKAIDDEEVKEVTITDIEGWDEPDIFATSEVERKAYVGEVKGIDEKERTVTHFISTEAVDRDRDVMEAGGVDLKNYKKNPIVAWAHDYRQPPIGKNLWIKKHNEDGKTGLLAKTKFAMTQFADEIFKLYQEGFLNAWSVGFIPVEVKDAEDEKSGAKRIISKWELLEYSAVPIPSNQDALMAAYQKGIIGKQLAEQLGIETKEEVMPEEEAKEEVIIEVEAPKKQEEKQPEPMPVAKSTELTGEEIQYIKARVIAGVSSWIDRALGKVTKEGIKDGRKGKG